LLIVYFAGFATAVYCLAPVPEDQACESDDDEKSFLDSALKSDDFAKSFNTGMHKCIEFSKNAASRTAKFIKQKLDERQLQTDG
jgi:hypothetical protein